MVALVSGGGHGTPQPGGDTLPFQPPGYLLEQYTYDPYGSIVAAENFDLDTSGKSLHAVNRVGHQGLFFERFDGSYIDQTLAEGGLPSQLATARATGLYYNRNRFYHPQLGRFLTRDPNETGLPIIAALAMNGEAVAALFGGLEGHGPFANGMNLYLYTGGNPVHRTDSSGLEWDDEFDPFGEVDEIVGEIQAERIMATERADRFMRALGRAAGIMALQTAIMVLVPGGGLFVAAWNVYDSVQDIYENELTWGNAFSLGLSLWGLNGEVRTAVDAIRSSSGELRTVYRGGKSAYVEDGRYCCMMREPYSHLDLTDEFPESRGMGKDYTTTQRGLILEANRARNGGVLRDDRTGEILRAEKGFDNSAEVHHTKPKSKGGSNRFRNAEVLSRKLNRQLGNET